MSDQSKPDEQKGFALDGLSAGEYDTSLSQPAPDDAGEALELPQGALLAFRRSGGLRFTTRTIIVYRDGWVLSVDEQAAWRFHLRADELDRLAHLALRAQLARHRPSGAAQPPDAYAYEIAARIGRRVRRAEAMGGSIPAPLAPLIRSLARLL
ncbi:hypothetical protein EKD04_002750 [Chloroflexales bacterium ZM16-3]|nr:hypothetical protein [Chloroflexales bacterium ZM16-3]